MKILSWNVNGLRSVYRKGFLGWFKKSGVDILCLQEIKADREQIPPEIVKTKGYYAYFNPAKRKGYSGTAIFTKEKPRKIRSSLGFKRFDTEGRIMEAAYNGFALINLYLPYGGRGKENLKYKLEVYKKLIDYLKKNKKKKIIMAGDFNIAHKEIDLARPKQNKNNIMFTPEERKQIDNILNLGFIDTFRQLNKEGGNYSWWPYFANARERNLGWRIDYVFISHNMASGLESAFILNQVRGSDHCPVGAEISR